MVICAYSKNFYIEKLLNQAKFLEIFMNLLSLFKRKNQQLPQKPLRERLNEVIVKLMVLNDRVKQRNMQLSMRNKELFDACVNALMSSERDKAIIYANELSSMRRMMATALKSQFSIEGLINRLQTINDVAELRESIAPIMNILRELKGQLSGILPDASRSIQSIEEAVEDTIAEVGTVSDVIVEPTILDEEVRKILAEASEVASQRSKSSKLEDLGQVLSSG